MVLKKGVKKEEIAVEESAVDEHDDVDNLFEDLDSMND